MPRTSAGRRLTRPEQREQTRQRVLDAAEALFAERGIAATSIEDIAESAGYSRGAFYSNFDDKDDLVLRLLERLNERNHDQIAAFLDGQAAPGEFFERLRERETGEHGKSLSLEYILYGLRNPAARPMLKRISDASLQATAEVVTELWRAQDVDPPIDAESAARILIALDDGIDMRREIDPEGYPLGVYTDILALLQEAVVALSEKRRTGN